MYGCIVFVVMSQSWFIIWYDGRTMVCYNVDAVVLQICYSCVTVVRSITKRLAS
jgi:hypothetical protein